MDRASALIDRFADHAFRRRGVSYFCRRTALEIVDACRAEKLHILGIDGHFLTDRTTDQPLEWILDLSACPTDYQSAITFIEAGANVPLFYEFVLADPNLAGRGVD